MKQGVRMVGNEHGNETKRPFCISTATELKQRIRSAVKYSNAKLVELQFLKI